MKTAFSTRRVYTRPGRIHQSPGDFVCLNCGALVATGEALSGVRNRNHCPYCLFSRHLDQFEAGDRLSACKACMRPVGLTFKRIARKYARQGELMLVHLCDDCGKLSINRIAADDDADLILAVLEQSNGLAPDVIELMTQAGITLASVAQTELVRQCLLGVNYAR